MPSPAPASVDIDGGRLRELRKLRGKSMSALARESEISVQFLSVLELDPKRRCSPEVFDRICTALRLTSDDDRRALMRPTVASAA